MPKTNNADDAGRSRNRLARFKSGISPFALQKRIAAFSAADLSLSLWSLSKLLINPPRPWMNSFLIECYERLPQFRSQDFSNLLLALAHMRCQPPEEWTQAFLRESAPKLNHFSAQVS